MSTSSIWPIDKTLSGACQSGPRSNNNEGVLHIHQSSRDGDSPSDSFLSYPGHSLWRVGSYSSAEMQSVYSAAQTDEKIFSDKIYGKNHFQCIL